MYEKTFGELDLIDSINIDDVVKTLKENPELWDIDTFRQRNYRVHKDTQSVVLIWTENRLPFRRVVNEKILKLFNPFISKLIPILKNKFKYENPLVVKLMFAKLLPKGHIIPHLDNGPVLRIPQRIHIPIVTNKDVIATINGKEFYMETGRIYNFNNTLMHSVMNNSEEERIHCIIDYTDMEFFEDHKIM